MPAAFAISGAAPDQLADTLETHRADELRARLLERLPIATGVLRHCGGRQRGLLEQIAQLLLQPLEDLSVRRQDVARNRVRSSLALK